MARYYVREQKAAIGAWWLWIGVTAPAVIWALHLGVAYVVIGLDCYLSLFSFQAFGLTGLQLVLLGFTVVGAIGIILAGVLNVRNWRAVAGEHAPERDPTGRFQFISIAGAIMSGSFLVYMVWSSAPIIFSPQC